LLATSDEAGIVRYLSDADILVTMRLTAEMGHFATRLKLVQVPGAGLDAIERAALPADALLANVFGMSKARARRAIAWPIRP
jgi:phosphoglycerate dehydrogenase-like enzyme